MFKTFSDFARLASIVYHLPQQVAGQIIETKLREHGLSIIAVVAYINWADGDCLTHKQIASILKIPRRTVCWHLQKLAIVWPHLFNFGPKPPRTVNNHRGRKTIPTDALTDETEIKRMF